MKTQHTENYEIQKKQCQEETMAINAYIGKLESYQIHDLVMQLKDPKSNSKPNPKLVDGKK